LLLILALALVRGLLYLAVMPPWQHYDEPTHFEYVRLLATRKRLPQPGDYDLALRREIAASMQAANFWKDLGPPTLDFWTEQPPDIGLSELEHPPLYYALLAVPQLLAAHQSVETQLYLARLTSLLLYLAVVGGAYGLAREVLPRRRWLPEAVATFIACLPPLTDLMSSVNNDVGAAAATTLFLWASVRLARRGPSPWRVAATLALAATCFATKSTAGFVAAAVLAILVISYVPRCWRRWVWIGGVAALALVLAGSMTLGGYAAHWYSVDSAAAPNRVLVDTPLGRAAFALSSAGRDHPRILSQELGRADGRRLRGQTVTLGAWVRAAEGETSRVTLLLSDGLNEWQRQIQASGDWQFCAFTATVSAEAPGVAVRVSLPGRQAAVGPTYVDGLVLVEGDLAAATPASFQAIENQLKNGSAERVRPGLRPAIGQTEVYRQPTAQVFQSLLDWSRTAWVYGPELSMLLRSFWGGFGWNHLSLPTPYSYLLGALTLASVAGTALALARRLGRASSASRRVAAILGIALLTGWGGTFLRIHPVFFVGEHLFWPVARYASVAIAPTAALLCLGWRELVPRRWVKPAAWLGLLTLLALDAIALWTVILPYYYG
jgi:hypothetical protein